MRSRTRDNLTIAISFIFAIILGIVSKFAFDTSWWAAPIFGFGTLVVLFTVFTIIDIIDDIMRFFQGHRRLKAAKDKLDRERWQEFDRLPATLSADTRWNMVNSILAENDKKQRINDLVSNIAIKNEQVKLLTEELTTLNKLLNEEGVNYDRGEV